MSSPVVDARLSAAAEQRAHEECDFMSSIVNCTTHNFFCNLTREQQICRLGWLLLFLWLATILWMTKDLWCCNSPIEAASEECILNNEDETRRTDFGTAC
ncbi:hypothetical protein Aduo_011564 [Ancylostoma duodenale]